MAQTNPAEIKNDFQASSLNQPGQEYPGVNSQGYVRFRIKAPKADSIQVTLGLGGRGGTKLIKGADGYFTGTTEGAMDEGFHYYHLIVDGGVFNDPGTLNYYGSTRWESKTHKKSIMRLEQVRARARGPINSMATPKPSGMRAIAM